MFCEELEGRNDCFGITYISTVAGRFRMIGISTLGSQIDLAASHNRRLYDNSVSENVSGLNIRFHVVAFWDGPSFVMDLAYRMASHALSYTSCCDSSHTVFKKVSLDAT